MSLRKNLIVNAVKEALPDAQVDVFSEDDEHFEAIVKSAAFEGLSLVKQQQLVMRALKDLLATEVHALRLKTEILKA